MIPGASYFEYVVGGALDLHSLNDLKENEQSVGIECVIENPTIIPEEGSVNLFIQFEHSNIITLEHAQNGRQNGRSNGVNGNHINGNGVNGV